MSRDPRILVAMGTPIEAGGSPTVILGMTDATWADLAGGRAQDIDLRKLGVPAMVLIMRGTDQADITRQLQAAAGELEIPTGNLADLSVPKPTTN